MVGGPQCVASQVEEEKNETWKEQKGQEERTEEDKEMPIHLITCK